MGRKPQPDDIDGAMNAAVKHPKGKEHPGTGDIERVDIAGLNDEGTEAIIATLDQARAKLEKQSCSAANAR